MNDIISVIIPCLNEEKYIGELIEDILKQDYLREDTEILFFDGGSKDRTKEIIADYAARYPFLQLHNNAEKFVPFALNEGIRISKGDAIIILGAHASYPPNYFSTLYARLGELKADNVGAVCETKVHHDNPKTQAIKAVLSHPIGVGDSLFRTGVTKPTKVDTTAFSCYRKSKLVEVGGFDTRLTRNQDIELNKRIITSGGSIFLIPDTRCTYFARESLSAMARNNYLNGYWNLLTVYLTKDFRSLSLRHFIPMFFLLSLMIPVLLSPVIPAIIWLAFLSGIAYSLAIFLVSIRLDHRPVYLFFLLCSFPTLHFSYGAGSLAGLFRVDKLFVSKG